MEVKGGEGIARVGRTSGSQITWRRIRHVVARDDVEAVRSKSRPHRRGCPAGRAKDGEQSALWVCIVDAAEMSIAQGRCEPPDKHDELGHPAFIHGLEVDLDARDEVVRAVQLRRRVRPSRQLRRIQFAQVGTVSRVHAAINNGDDLQALLVISICGHLASLAEVGAARRTQLFVQLHAAAVGEHGVDAGARQCIAIISVYHVGPYPRAALSCVVHPCRVADRTKKGLRRWRRWQRRRRLVATFACAACAAHTKAGLG